MLQRVIHLCPRTQYYFFMENQIGPPIPLKTSKCKVKWYTVFIISFIFRIRRQPVQISHGELNYKLWFSISVIIKKRRFILRLKIDKICSSVDMQQIICKAVSGKHSAHFTLEWMKSIVLTVQTTQCIIYAVRGQLNIL